MAKVKNLDVWIVESNTVYQAVPFTVVTDWVTQGRLLAEDKVRPAGTEEWFVLAKVKQLSPYLPRPEPPRAEDEAEALEPMAFDLPYRKPRTDPEDDVDMIPLIDVSLVLLIYFMMLLAAADPIMPIPLPDAAWAEQGGRDGNAVSVLMAFPQEEARYGLQRGKTMLVKNAEDPDELVAEAKRIFSEMPDKVDLTINADTSMPSGKVRDMVARLTIVPEIKAKILGLYIGTGGRKTP